MTDCDWLTTQFESSRPRLRADTWLRLGASDPDTIDNFHGWLTTVIARVCLDRLRSRRARREDAAGAHPSDDVVDTTGVNDPAGRAIMAESVGAALLIVLDSLAPAERVAFVLHDVFAMPFDEIAGIVGRSPEAARKLASRARRRLQGTAATADVDLVRQREIVEAFLRAARGGDFDALVRMLDPDVELRPDPAAQRMGSLRHTRGAAAVATLLSGGARATQLAIMDGLAGLVWAPSGRTRGVIEFTIRDGKIVALDAIGDVERIRALEIVTLDGASPGSAVTSARRDPSYG